MIDNKTPVLPPFRRYLIVLYQNLKYNKAYNIYMYDLEANIPKTPLHR